MTGALTLLRALWHRAGTSVVILLVALCAAAAATVGPTYYVAARDSILQDDLTDASVVGRGVQILQNGPVVGSLPAFQGRVDTVVDRYAGGAAATDRLFLPSVAALETTAFFPDLVENVVLAWRSDVCAHLAFRDGRCAAARNEVDVSTSLAADNHWKVGDRIHPAGRPAMRVAGIYTPPDAGLDYWFARGTVYFPAEVPTENAAPYDALFTPRSTIEGLKGNPQGAAIVVRVLDVPKVTPADVDNLSTMATGLVNTPDLAQSDSHDVLGPQATVTSGISSTVDDVHESWSALAVPVLVVTAELLVLTWLLLFLVVTDAVEATGTEIALAKLRGFGGGRALLFGLGGPATLLAIALPVGALVGWALTGALSHALLRPGTPVPLPGLGWAAAAVATVGGVAAVVVAGRRTVVRPVVEQWRRTGRRANDRSWVFDAVVLTAAVAGLVQLAVTGTLSSASHSALALLVPGLLGLAIAVVASRLLPVICHALFGRTRRGGGLGPFLAVRHIARRPGGTRTTMILATAVALATFSICAWTVGKSNRARVAKITVGAPTVMTVAPPLGRDLATTVDRLDPGGRSASAVRVFDNGTVELLAVEPKRFAHVAHWDAGLVHDPTTLLDGLHPPAGKPIVLDSGPVRLRFDRVRLESMPSAAVTLDVVAGGSSAPTPVELGTLHSGGGVQLLGGSLSGCPCVVRDLQVSPPAGRPADLSGTLTIAGLEVGDSGGGWRPVAGFAGAGHWSDTQDQQVIVDANDKGIRWSFFATKGSPPTLRVIDRPEPMPAVVSKALDVPDTSVQSSGLNGAGLAVTSIGTAPGIPGAADRGVVVDLDYAVRAAADSLGPSTAQVWVRGDADRIRKGLVAAGIPVISTDTSGALTAALGRQGPGLASVLFLADAAAAAVLAALAAVLSLSAAARRRRYEYAALAATGASRRTLYAALSIEQLVVIGFGALTGIGAGLLATGLAGRSVPEFVTTPASPLLSYRPSTFLLVSVLTTGVVILFAVAALAAGALLRSVTPEQLREAPV